MNSRYACPDLNYIPNVVLCLETDVARLIGILPEVLARFAQGILSITAKIVLRVSRFEEILAELLFRDEYSIVRKCSYSRKLPEFLQVFS
jgi:DNA-binding transcriptional regulator YdaS (Cro superfamily)